MPPKNSNKNKKKDSCDLNPNTQRITRSRAGQQAKATETATTTTSTTTLAARLASTRKQKKAAPEAPPITTNERESNRELIDKALDDAKKGLFPKIELQFSDQKFPYTAILNLFKISRNFNFTRKQMEHHQVPVVCIFCNNTYHSRQGRFTNCNAHIDDHVANGNLECKEWLKRYREFKQQKQPRNEEKNQNKSDLLLVYHFIASNSALTQLKEKSFIKICEKAGIKIVNRKSFTKRILQDAMDMLKEKIEEKLISASRVCLITDIWTNKQMLDFIAVSANIIYEETVVIGMIKMPGPHNAENIKIGVEKIVNEYNFDKTKVDGKKKFFF